MRRYLAENPKNKHGVHRYTLAQFGLDRAEVGRRFEPYCQYFGIEPELAWAR